MASRRADNLLEEYRSRRDFTKTREPHDQGRAQAGGDQLQFVVQKHDARAPHYDFRLECDGVLKSWAVTKGPSIDPSEKRLAVRTEDHPLDYGSFEGTIPEGQYGGGTVMIWDRGWWEPEDDAAAGIENGKLTFQLHGERLAGKWSLVRMRKGKEKRENWLLIKADDGQASRRGDLLKRHAKSAASGRTMRQIAREKVCDPAKTDDKDEKKKAGQAKKKEATETKTKGRQRHALPRWREPQLASLVDEAPKGGEWLSELKYDGYRALIAVAAGDAVVYTRNGKDWTGKFPDVARAAAALKADSALLDGEIVAFKKDGKTDFSTLQTAINSGGDMACFVFDLLEHNGENLRDLALADRKKKLERLLGSGSEPLIYSPDVKGGAAGVHARMCAAGHEGIVAKRADAPYRSGRGQSWLKVKCTRRQEFVIGGYSPSDKKGRPFASLLLGVPQDNAFVYKGRVGTGFNEDVFRDLAARFKRRQRRTSPFTRLPRDIARGVRYLTPDLVAEIDFAEFTADGLVRHGVYKGLRDDKKAEEVVMETSGKAQMTDNGNADDARDAVAGVKLSSPDKVLFSGQGVTKLDLAAHYERVSQRLLPHIARRFVSLVRCPEGETRECFFQRHGHKGFPKQVKRSQITGADGKREEYLHADDLSGVIAAVQMGTLEFHIWGARIDNIERPDRLVFDLDPDENLPFSAVRDAAFDMRDRLDAIGLKTVPLVTGGKGIHVVAPLERRADWAQVKRFAEAFARARTDEEPDRYVAQAAKAKRKGRIFIDYLRNERGASAIAPYSTRAYASAPVATPVSWGELESLKSAAAFHIGDMKARLEMADPWEDAKKWRQSVTKAMVDDAERSNGNS